MHMKRLRITIGNKSYEVTVEDLTEAGPTAGHGDRPAAAYSAPPATAGTPPARGSVPREAGAVTSPMAGVVKSILVGEGEEVRQGQPLVVLEAMKMENQIVAPIAGRVLRLEVKEGASVSEGHVLLILE